MRSAVVDRRLEAIAGPPLAMLTVPNTSSAPLGLGTTEPRTLYAVGASLGNLPDTEIASLGGASGGFQILRNRGTGLTGMTHRAQTLTSGNIFQQFLTGVPFGQLMVGCGWWTGAVFGAQGRSEDPIVSSSAPGEMNSNPSLRLRSDANVTGVAAIAYRGVHDLVVRTRILNWLAQRYQVTPPRWIALALIWCWQHEGRSGGRQDRTRQHPGDPARTRVVASASERLVTRYSSGCPGRPGMAGYGDRWAAELWVGVCASSTRQDSADVCVAAGRDPRGRIAHIGGRCLVRRPARRRELRLPTSDRRGSSQRPDHMDAVSGPLRYPRERCLDKTVRDAPKLSNRRHVPTMRRPSLDHRSYARVGGAR